MEKGRGSRLIAIIALCVAVVGLSIGFAAFTKDLNITFSDSNVNVSGDLDIKFLVSNDPTDTSTTVNGISLNTDGSENVNILVEPATISTDGTTISGLEAMFNDKGQAVRYDFYIYNNSEYDAYIKAVDFLNYAGFEKNKVCTALEGTTQSLVDAACEDIHIMIEVDFNGDGHDDVEIIDFYEKKNSIMSGKLLKGEVAAANILIFYTDDTMSNLLDDRDTALIPNGDFKINFGAIKLNYSSLEG